MEGAAVTILALDLGTTTGWAVRHESGRVTSGTVTFKPSRYEGGGMRFLRFARWLDEMSNAGAIEAILFEEVRRHAGTDAAHAYGGFLAHLTAWAEHHRIPYTGIPVGTIKRAATGKGNASKDDMIAAMRRAGYAPADDNEADAIAIALHFDADGSQRERT
jgi:Holliday junction resolvasome RuvABC endonuclease subunit